MRGVTLPRMMKGGDSNRAPQPSTKSGLAKSIHKKKPKNRKTGSHKTAAQPDDRDDGDDAKVRTHKAGKVDVSAVKAKTKGALLGGLKSGALHAAVAKMEADEEAAAPAAEEAAPAAEEAAPAAETKPAAYLLADATLNCEHDMAQMMPSTVEEFCTVLATGERAPWSGAQAELACTGGQKELLGSLIPKFNGAGTPIERMTLIGEFLVEAAKLEGLTDYKMILKPNGALFVEDFPNGPDEHGQTLAVGVLRWCRFEAAEPAGRLQSKLMDLKPECFDTAAERDAALAKVGEEAAEGEEAANGEEAAEGEEAA